MLAALLATGRLGDAARLLEDLVLDDDFSDFLTIPAYPELDAG